MVFSSLLFIFIYLVVTLALYYAVPNRVYRNVILCVLSLIFYGWGEPSFVLLMIFSIAFNWLAGLLVGKYRNNKKCCKAVLVASVVLNLALLGVFKYTGFVVDTLKAVFPFMRSYATPIIPLPIGISFYTFQAMSYVIDVYRNDTSVQKNPVYFGTYVALFPQLIAGPIVRYRDIADQLENRHENVAQFASGIKLFTVGLAKKVLLANQLIALWNVLRASSAANGVLGSWVGIIAYTLHIYFDFGGYSDMAIGLGRMFGFEFLKNFDYPYISRSISEFWRRWHISLSTWFREYLYIPLGGNRKGKAKTYWNKLIVFFCTGLWHGANWTFIVWGLWHGFFIVAEDAVKKLFGLEKHGKGGRNPACAVLKHLYTLLVVLVGFVIFRADNMGQAFSMIGAMFSGGSASAQTGLLLAQCLTPLTLFALAVGLVGSTPVLPLVCRKAEQQTGSVYACLQALSYAGALALLLVDILHLSAASYVPFIYFQF